MTEATCAVCTETFNRTIRSPVRCCFCEYAACMACTKRYVLSSVEDPHCMSCRRRWNTRYLDSILSNAFRTGPYARHRENVLIDRERSMLPATQVHVESTILLERYDAREKEIGRELALVNNRMTNLRLRRRRVSMMEPGTVPAEYDDVDGVTEAEGGGDEAAPPPTQAQARAAFVKPCPTQGCRGFLSTAYKCGICGTRACPDCHEVVAPPTTAPTVEAAEAAGEGAPPGAVEGGDAQAHVCNPEVLASVRAIAADSKACPSCGAMIFRVSGCYQMYCTVPGCHTAFDFVTGRVETGRIHNPHYYEFMRRNGGEPPREPGDRPCDPDEFPGFVALNRHPGVRSVPAAQAVIVAVHMLATHVRLFELPRYPTQNPAEGMDVVNRDLRIQYMRNRLVDASFKKKLLAREKRRNYKADVHDVLVMVCVVIGDVLRALIADRSADAYPTAKRALDELRAYANASLLDVSRDYNFVVPNVSDAWKIVSVKA